MRRSQRIALTAGLLVAAVLAGPTIAGGAMSLLAHPVWALSAAGMPDWLVLAALHLLRITVAGLGLALLGVASWHIWRYPTSPAPTRR